MNKVVKKNSVILKNTRTFGQKSADNLSKWAGSWTFIISFGFFLILWILVNTQWLIFGQPWDVKPYIMLNLVLSCIAAIQAPIILMSQNRQTQRDRSRAQYDYSINKKSEREIREIKKQLTRIESYIIKKKIK